MKQILIAVLLGILAMPILAQTGEGEIENWTEFRVICAEDARVLIEVEVSKAIVSVSITPDNSNSFTWVPKQASRRFWVSGENSYVSIYVEVRDLGGHWVGAFSLDTSRDCDDMDLTPAEPSIPMNECLGISLDDLITMTAYTPESGEFVVDGNVYPFADNLSFFVPSDAVWVWDLYIDGLHLLRFEQSAEMACAITAVYIQE